MKDSSEIKHCLSCLKNFSIFPEDWKFLKKFTVPAPTLCPDCREQRRTLHINQLNLFKSKCIGSGKNIISCYPPDSPYKVCDQEYWYSDAVDNTEFGRDYDFSRPFFEQFKDLQLAAFRPCLFTDFSRDENSDYTNYAGKNKNCYLIFDSDENWDCYYSYSINGSRSSADCYRVENLELCYEVVDSRNCYNTAFIYNSENCIDSYFLNNCIGCKNCILCSNLRQKQYYFRNKAISKEEFSEIKKKLENYSEINRLIKEFLDFKLKFPQKALRGFQNENVQGNYLTNCKNAYHCFDCRDGWDLRYCFQSFMEIKDCMDADECGEAQLVYECTNLGYNALNMKFSKICLNQLSNLTYCDSCFNGCSDLFGCVGLKKKQYCILNQQYSKEEYLNLVPKIIEQMKVTKEWGEFFPASCSVTAYNLSIAQILYPLSREEAQAKGFFWREEEKQNFLPATTTLKDSLREIDDSITKEILSCSECTRSYKIIAQELKFHQTLGLAFPRKCFLCRHQARLASRNPRVLIDRTCDHCNCSLQCAYPITDKTIVYCENCYLESLI